MGYSYELTHKAAKDLDNILDYFISDLGSMSAAAHFIEGFEKAAQEACAFPKSGEVVENEFLPSGEYRKKLVGDYVCVYTADHESRKITFIALFYGKMNADERFKAL